jgi:anti-sigma-K factor RskA
MSGRDLMPGGSDCGGDAAAYVLGALEPGEVDAFRRHMEECAVCRDEVAALQPVADTLPMAAQQVATPRGLRRRVMRQVREDARAAGRVRRASPGRGWVPRPALAGGLAAVVAVAAAGVVELSGGSSGTRVFPSSVGYAQLRISGGHAELVVNRLAQPTAGRIYEVWLQRPNRPPAPTKALFSPTSRGAADVDVPGNLRGVSQVMVTQERGGGSLVPTSSPVVVTPLT